MFLCVADSSGFPGALPFNSRCSEPAAARGEAIAVPGGLIQRF